MSVQALVDGWNARRGDRVAAAFTKDGVRIEYARPGARLEERVYWDAATLFGLMDAA